MDTAPPEVLNTAHTLSLSSKVISRSTECGTLSKGALAGGTSFDDALVNFGESVMELGRWSLAGLMKNKEEHIIKKDAQEYTKTTLTLGSYF